MLDNMMHLRGKLFENDEEHLNNSRTLMEKYMIWKMKKWNALWKKEKAEAKKEKILISYDTEQVVCKI